MPQLLRLAVLIDGAWKRVPKGQKGGGQFAPKDGGGGGASKKEDKTAADMIAKEHGITREEAKKRIADQYAVADAKAKEAKRLADVPSKPRNVAEQQAKDFAAKEQAAKDQAAAADAANHEAAVKKLQEHAAQSKKMADSVRVPPPKGARTWAEHKAALDASKITEPPTSPSRLEDAGATPAPPVKLRSGIFQSVSDLAEKSSVAKGLMDVLRIGKGSVISGQGTLLENIHNRRDRSAQQLGLHGALGAVAGATVVNKLSEGGYLAAIPAAAWLGWETVMAVGQFNLINRLGKLEGHAKIRAERQARDLEFRQRELADAALKNTVWGRAKRAVGHLSDTTLGDEALGVVVDRDAWWKKIKNAFGTHQPRKRWDEPA